MNHELYHSMGEFDREIEYYTHINKIIQHIQNVMADLENSKFIAPSEKCQKDFALFKGYLMNAKNHGYKFVYEYSDEQEDGAWVSKIAIVSEDCSNNESKLEELIRKGYFMEVPNEFRDFMCFAGVEFPYCLAIE